MMEISTLGAVADYYNGRAFKPTEWEEQGLPIIRIQNLNKPEAPYNYSNAVYEDRFLAKNGELLFAWSASLGAFIWQGADAWVNQHIFKVTPKECTDKMYLYYFLLHVIDELYSKTHGSGMVHITLKPFKETLIPLPSLQIQRLMVSHIGSLFEKLDRAKELVQSALDSFENRKAAILHKAFSGELTAKWRKAQGIGLDSWKTGVLLDFVQEKPRNGYSPSAVDFPTAVRSLSLSATTSGTFDGSFFKYLDIVVESDSHLWLKKDDILIQRANSIEKVGTSALYTDADDAFIYPDLMMRIRANEKATPHYLAYSLKTSKVMEYYRSNATGTAGNMPKINQTVVSNTPIIMPTVEEQREIVRILDTLLEQEKAAQEFTDILEKIDCLKKVILAHAFCGRLGTNDPDEESAIDLLKWK